MASTQVTIIYSGIVGEIERDGAPIARMLQPTGSYVDLPVMTEGYVNTESVGDGEGYGPSIYATNHDRLGNLPGIDPMGGYTGRFVQFAEAIRVAAESAETGDPNEGVTFDVDTLEDILYWKQMGRNMADRFYTQVGDESFGTAPALTPDDSNPDDSKPGVANP